MVASSIGRNGTKGPPLQNRTMQNRKETLRVIEALIHNSKQWCCKCIKLNVTR